MLLYRVSGIPEQVATSVRSELRAPGYGHPAHAEIATGYGPCRLCLQTFTVGVDERLLFTYQPFTDPTALPAPGPVFIHREPCERYDAFGLPDDLRLLPLVVEGYSDRGMIVCQHRVGSANVDAVLSEVLDLPETRYAHLRNGEAGCFIARVERAASD